MAAADPRPFNPLDYESIAKSIVDALLPRSLIALEDVERFPGSGIYALYYTGDFPAYELIASPAGHIPIYVGKGAPGGGRTGSGSPGEPGGRKLYERLRMHCRSITRATNLDVANFLCRYLVVEPVWVPLAERVLISGLQPVWNVVVSGFGNNAPGGGRGGTELPLWDILHPGRPWAEGLQSETTSAQIIADIRRHLREHTGG